MKHAPTSQRILWLGSAFFALCLGFLSLAISLFLMSKSTTFQFFGEIIPRVETDKKMIALTFDDGPTDKADEVLRILEETNTQATFFVIGKDIEKHPHEFKKLVDAGHEIGNHSYSHQRMVLKSWQFINTELDRTYQLISTSGYTGPIHFRPPYGKKLFLLPYSLSQKNMKTITWDVAPETDAQIASNTNAIVQHVLEKTRSGSIILLHPWYGAQQTRDAIKPIIEGLKNQGYEFVTVSELLQEKR